MSLIKTLYTVLLFTTVYNTLTLPSNENTSIRQPGSMLNSSFFADNDLSVHCNGRQFGTDLDGESCLDALNTFELAGSSASFVVHRRRIGSFTRALPWKWVSGNNHLGSCQLGIHFLQIVSANHLKAHRRWPLRIRHRDEGQRAV